MARLLGRIRENAEEMQTQFSFKIQKLQEISFRNLIINYFKFSTFLVLKILEIRGQSVILHFQFFLADSSLSHQSYGNQPIKTIVTYDCIINN